MERNGAVIRASELETVLVAASKLGVSRQRIAQMFDEGKVDYYQIGKRRFIHKRDLDRLIRQREKRKIA